MALPAAYPVSGDQVVENAVALEVIGGRTQRPKDAPLTMTRVSSRRLSGENPQNALARSYSAKTQSHIQKGLKDVDKMGKERNKLGQWLSTGLCGNNITSSALYVVAICSVPAGKYAPIALGCIAVLLYLFRGIYEEVVMALPVNGGTYNLLLNTSSKAKASLAACLTMLSYVTTAVISATSAMRYPIYRHAVRRRVSRSVGGCGYGGVVAPVDVGREYTADRGGREHAPTRPAQSVRSPERWRAGVGASRDRSASFTDAKRLTYSSNISHSISLRTDRKSTPVKPAESAELRA